MISRRLLLSLVPASVLLSACAIVPESARLRRGKFSFSLSTAQGQSAEQGRYELTETAEYTRLDLITPLGGVLVRITLTPHRAVLEHGDAISEASTAEELMKKELGLALPVSMLSSWLDGSPYAKTAFRTISERSFEQQGWVISVRRRHPDGRPALIGAQTSSADFSARLTLSIDSEGGQR